ncbi:MAG: MerR family transcriptional regulator [candidate division KSB1 bacterium]|nr:MerR family transcriptional regulator [candidate division KSB1 bacterium]MDZ7339011.1 MerR family transcriptional regulator [candidate division KSB1 bacterium]
MADVPIKKLYYSIAEVSRITDVKPHVLRYWETEFPELRPPKNRAGNRTYKLDDIRLIFRIKRLLYVEKYTVAGARERLARERLAEKANARHDRQLSLSLEELKRQDLLAEIESELRGILDLLDRMDTNSGRGAVR